MERPRRDTQIPLRYRESSPPRLPHNNKRLKRRGIDPEIVDRNNLGQALAVIAAAPDCDSEPPTFISTELPQYEANYVESRSSHS
jgi:hypothetical protein